MLAVALALLLQVKVKDETVFSQERSVYWEAFNECQKAEKAIDTDPQAAIDKLTKIIDNAKIVKRECRMMIEELPGKFTAKFDFFPCQYRGRARQKLADGQEGAAAIQTLEAAKADLEESVKRGVEASGAFLKDVELCITKLRFNEALKDLKKRKQYGTALEHVKSGAHLDETERAKLDKEVKEECAAEVRQALEEYWTHVPQTLRAVREMPDEEFRRKLKFPSSEQLVGDLSALTWTGDFHAKLDALRSAQPEKALETAGAMLDVALSAPEIPGDRFNAAWRLGHAVLIERAQTALEEGRRGDASAVRRFRGEAAACEKRWREFAGKLKPPDELKRTLERRSADFQNIMEGFPTDLEDIDKHRKALDDAFVSDTPGAALAEVEGNLRQIYRDHGDNLVRETRRKLLTYLVTAIALRNLLGGKTVEAAAEAAREFAKPLALAGGAIDPDCYGPKAGAVFKELAK